MALLSYRDVSRRKNSTNIFTEDKDSYARYKKCKSYLDRVISSSINESNINFNIFHDYMINLRQANDLCNNITKPLNLISKCNENGLCKLSNSIFTDYIDTCYCMKDVNELNSSLIDRYKLTDDQKNKLSETVNIIQIADRIIKNHDIITERFKNINNKILEVPTKGLDRVLESICPLIDTFNIPDYQRYSATIEECWYMLESNHISYSKSDLISIITEYYMLASDTIDTKSKKGFRLALNRNALLEESDCCKVEYITNPDDEVQVCTIRDYINKYLSLNDKSIDTLNKVSMDAINSVSNDNFIYEIDKIIWLYWKTVRFETFEDCNDYVINDYMKGLADTILYNIENRDFSRDQINSIYDKISKVNSLLVFNAHASEDEVNTITQFKKVLDELLEKISDYNNIVYYEYNLDIINQINESDNIISLDEFKIFKFHNLIAAAFRANKYLQNKEKKLFNSVKNKIKKKFKKVKDILFPESVGIDYFLNDNGIAEACIAQYEYTESEASDMQDFLYETCKELNDQNDISKYYDGKFYYIMNPGVGEIHLGSTCKIDLSNEEKIELENIYNNSNDIYIEKFANIVNYTNILEDMSIDDLLFRINETKNNLNSEELDLAIEALEIFGVSSDVLRPITESYNSSIKPDNENNYYSIDIKLEAYDIFEAIMEKGSPSVKKVKVGPAGNSNNSSNSSNDNKPEDKDDEFAKENKFSGINFGKMKLALLGLKSKAKELGQKASELTRNLDGASERFMKSLKSAMVSDKREDIIKGRVIPSFSNIMKIGAALAGSFVISGFNPVVPVIGAIGGFAVSKNLTKKERVLLLDEIETELEVLEKEIQIAESNNKLKRLRELLRQKKELQRQYQRIRYNIRVGKDILPGSSVGVPSNND